MSPDFRRRDHRIDVLRGVSIIVVLILHFHLAYNLASSPFATFFSARLVEAIARNGNYGVVVFFVISGYLITSTSLRRFQSLGQVSTKAFYAFRFARIFPCLLLLLAIITPLAIAGVPHFQNNKPVSLLLADVSILTFWHNVLMAKVGYFNYGLNILWSLSVEEVFYISFPLLCLLLRKPRWIVPIWIAAIVAGPIYRFRHSDDEIRYLYGYLACFDAIAMGCCTALLTRQVRIRTTTRNIVQSCAMLWMAWVYLHGDIGSNAVWGPTTMAGGAAVFLLAEGSTGYTIENRATLLLAPIAWFGRRSYELYLFHIVILAAMRNVIGTSALEPGHKPLWFFLFIVLSVAFASLIARYYSEPLNEWIRTRLGATQRIRTYQANPALPV